MKEDVFIFYHRSCMYLYCVNGKEKKPIRNICKEDGFRTESDLSKTERGSEDKKWKGHLFVTKLERRVSLASGFPRVVSSQTRFANQYISYRLLNKAFPLEQSVQNCFWLRYKCKM
jgi:hypothetical protein